MRKLAKLQTSTMVEFLKDISSCGPSNNSNSTNDNSSKVAHLFHNDITIFNSHYILNKSIIAKNGTCSVVKYKKMYEKYISEIFSMFFKIQTQKKNGKDKSIKFLVKSLPNYKLYIETKIKINKFLEEEKKFKINHMKKNISLNQDNDDEFESGQQTDEDDNMDN